MEKLDKVFQKINDIFKTIRAGLEIVVDDLKWSFDKKVIPKSKATWLTVLMALLGATLGAAFGGITGGVIGLSLGVLLGLYLVGLDPETWKTEMDAEDAWIVVITALLGALLGVAGFSLGAILGLYLTGFAEGDEEHGGKSQLLSELIVVLCALLGAVIGSIVTPGVGTVVGMGLTCFSSALSPGFHALASRLACCASWSARKAVLYSLRASLKTVSSFRA